MKLVFGHGHARKRICRPWSKIHFRGVKNEKALRIVFDELKRYYNAVSQQRISVDTVQGSKLVQGCIEVYEVEP